jgi:hypothetical protein
VGSGRFAAIVPALALLAGGCASVPHPRSHHGSSEGSLSGPVVTTELSLERRRELNRLIEKRMGDNKLIAVSYDGQHLRMQSDCEIVGRYDEHEAGFERQFDTGSAVFVVEEQFGIDGFVRVVEPTSASFRETRRLTLPWRPPPRPNDQACAHATHVVEEMIVGVEPGADEHAESLPVVLRLVELPGEPPLGYEPPPRPRERPPKQEHTPRSVALTFATVTLFVLSVGLAFVPEDEL